MVYFDGCRKRIAASGRAGGQRKSLGLFKEVEYTGTTVQRRSLWRPGVLRGVGRECVGEQWRKGKVEMIHFPLFPMITLHLLLLLLSAAFAEVGLARH